MVKRLSLFVVLLSLWAPAAWACAGTDVSVGHCCKTIGETRLSPDKTSVFACLAEAPNGSQGAWTNTSSSGAAPTGAIMAFDAAACPSGWSAVASLAGRTIIGSGSGAGLTARSLGATGGEEKHVLSISEMPKHQHFTMFADGGGPSCGGVNRGPTTLWWNDKCYDNQEANTRRSAYAGNNGAHNTMPPFMALLYCKKD